MYKFKNKFVERIIFNHPSVEKSLKNRNFFQKLELIGDKLIGFFLTKFLFDKSINESDISLKISLLASKDFMGQIGNFLIKDIQYNGLLTNKIIANCLEAYIGGVYMDGGNVENIIFELWRDYLDLSSEKPIKTQLQEKGKIYYDIENTGSGFIATCCVNNKLYSGEGRSKKVATTQAAARALGLE